MGSLLMTSTFLPRIGGRELYLHNLFSRFPMGEAVVVTYDREGDWQTFDRRSSLPVIRVNQDDFHWYFQGRRERLKWFAFLAKLCLQEHVDVVHCGLAIPDGMSGWLLKKVLGKPYVVYTYAKEILEPWPTEWHRRKFQWVLRGADRVVTISKYTEGRLVQLGVDPSRIVMVYPGVDHRTFHPETAAAHAIRVRHGISDGQPVLLTVARLVLRKGHDKVIEALATISEQVPDIVYLVVGEGPEADRLQMYARDRGVGDRLIFAGPVPDDELPAYYNAADVFIMPNRDEGTDVEGFGIVFLEANACGKPVIGGRSGGAVDAIADGETGYLVDPCSPPDIAQSAVRLLSDPALARRMGERGRERARQDFSWDRAARQVQTLTAEVAAVTKRRRMAWVHPGRLARSCRFFLQQL